ncbi:type I restriction endonuclease subunit R [Halanaerobium sp.]|jgi:type I restriction enzyme R subunit|uniref:type I restriction endonuclease subunit R n=1 Tax=Halanaerobium sp. TaxID=1895664 RepID=UPI000DE69614|nr:type I restriction endonuclease subunit R [Halanaerobium sp.]PUU87515.1 MAG: type I restriction enzyme, R subunit [Halanaerobium sp.]
MFTEEELEEAGLAWFKELNYSIASGPKISPGGEYPERDDYREVVLKDRLRNSLYKINSEIPNQALETAVRKILIPEEPSLLENNRNFHNMLTDGIDVEYEREDGSIKGDKVWIFDQENINNNDWLLVNQFAIKEGNQTRRPDLIVFLNGLPLVVIELKSATKEKATIDKAYNQLQTYKKEIPSLFTYNQMLITSDGHNARVGTITANKERFMPWRSIDGEEIAPTGIPEMEVLIKGIFQKYRFLDLIHHYILFQDDGLNITKIFAAYHQYHAVDKAINSTAKAISDEGDRRIGVVWHTQGSGKSLSMVFYAGKLVLGLDNPTIVVITDRNDLDDQLFGTFSSSSDLLRQKPKQAESREDLKKLLSVEAGGIIFTTIQKFEESADNSILTDRKNVIVIADEAHRSQYGFDPSIKQSDGKAETKYGYAKYMRDALPNASYIGFTGTPIEMDDKNTPAVFGGYIDVYDMTRAVKDEMTVKIYYESKIVQVKLPDDQKDLLDSEIDELTEGIIAEEREKYKARNSALEAVVAADSRLKTVAEEIVKHFKQRQEAILGKGMIVTISRRAAVKLYDKITDLKPNWRHKDDEKGKIKVVMSGDASDPESWQPHIRPKSQRKVIEKRMKDEDDSLKLVIVCDMWLTGFDVPPLHTMYIDKPLKGHNLMQAIARVNRVYKDKPGGLIVDFIGIADALKKALMVYTESDRKNTAIDTEEALKELLKEYEILNDIFYKFNYKRFFKAKPQSKMRIITEAMEYILSLDDEPAGTGEERFIRHVNRLSKAYALCSTTEKAQSISEDIAFFKAVKTALRKHFNDGEKNPQDIEGAINQMVSKAIAADGVIDIFEDSKIDPDMSILSEEFLEEIKHLRHKNLAARTLEQILKTKVKALAKKNLVKSKKFSEMLDETINKYRNRAIETREVIEELIKLAQEMNKAKNEENELGLNEDEVAFYDALGVNDAAVKIMGDEILKKIAVELAETIRNSTTIDWNSRKSVRAKMKVKIKRLLRKYGYPPDKQKKAIATVMEQAEEMCDRD